MNNFSAKNGAEDVVCLDWWCLFRSQWVKSFNGVWIPTNTILYTTTPGRTLIVYMIKTIIYINKYNTEHNHTKSNPGLHDQNHSVHQHTYIWGLWRVVSSFQNPYISTLAKESVHLKCLSAKYNFSFWNMIGNIVSKMDPWTRASKSCEHRERRSENKKFFLIFGINIILV